VPRLDGKSSGSQRALLGIGDNREGGAVRQVPYAISPAGALTDIKALSWLARRAELCRDPWPRKRELTAACDATVSLTQFRSPSTTT
jgi:hypothetical protein